MSEIDEVLAGYMYDEEHVWQLYKDGFLKRDAANRDAEIKGLDAFMETKMDTPSREVADLLSRRRQLLDLHGMLRKLGR